MLAKDVQSVISTFSGCGLKFVQAGKQKLIVQREVKLGDLPEAPKRYVLSEYDEPTLIQAIINDFLG